MAAQSAEDWKGEALHHFFSQSVFFTEALFKKYCGNKHHVQSFFSIKKKCVCVCVLIFIVTLSEQLVILNCSKERKKNQITRFLS